MLTIQESLSLEFPYISKGVKISRSVHHKGMFIFSYPDGGFMNISSTAEIILLSHPPDVYANIHNIFKEHTLFKFTHTSNYTAAATGKKAKPTFKTGSPNQAWREANHLN